MFDNKKLANSIGDDVVMALDAVCKKYGITIKIHG